MKQHHTHRPRLVLPTRSRAGSLSWLELSSCPEQSSPRRRPTSEAILHNCGTDDASSTKAATRSGKQVPADVKNVFVCLLRSP